MGPLVDTSVLIDYFGGTLNRESDLLDLLLADGEAPSTAPLIVQEFLQGFSRARDIEAARQYLEPFVRLEAPGYETHDLAAGLHRTLKRQGYTTPTVDAVIVAMAQSADCALLTRDEHQRQLARVAEVTLL